MRAPDTREAIKQALADRGLSPLHRHGQNFLIRKTVLDRVAAAARVGEGDVVLEVGPGCGGLTDRLLESGARVVAAEIDRGLAELVADTFGDDPGFTLVRGDVMGQKSALADGVLDALAAAGAWDRGWTVAANLPYQISSPFLSACALLPRPPRRLVVTLQKEVGEVLRAGPGDSAYSALSFLSRLAWTVGRLEALAPGSFWPAPKVDSVVLEMDAREPRPTPLAETIGLARRLFQRRRKALRGTVRDLVPKGVDVAGLLESVGLSGDDRIDAVDPEAIERLAAALPSAHAR